MFLTIWIRVRVLPFRRGFAPARGRGQNQGQVVSHDQSHSRGKFPNFPFFSFSFLSILFLYLPSLFVSHSPFFLFPLYPFITFILLPLSFKFFPIHSFFLISFILLLPPLIPLFHPFFSLFLIFLFSSPCLALHMYILFSSFFQLSNCEWCNLQMSRHPLHRKLPNSIILVREDEDYH